MARAPELAATSVPAAGGPGYRRRVDLAGWALWRLGAPTVAWMIVCDVLAVVAAASSTVAVPLPDLGVWASGVAVVVAGVVHGRLTRPAEERRRARARRLGAVEHVDLTSVYLLPVALLTGPLVIVAAVVVLRAQRYPVAGKAPSRYLFTSAAICLSALAAHVVAVAWPGESVRPGVGWVCAAAAYYVVQAVVVGVARGLSSGRWGAAALLGGAGDNALIVAVLGLALLAVAAAAHLWMLPAVVAVTVLLTRALQLRHAADHDAKTGLLNLRGFRPRVEAVLGADRVAGVSTGVLMIDVDRFKRWNTELGHAGADELLLTVTDAVAAAIRRGDLLCRWGGEELVVVLPATGVVEALGLAERVRAAVEGLTPSISRPSGGLVRRVGGDLPRCTVSVGVAVSPTDGVEFGALLDVADRALAAAKAGGRNRVAAAACQGV